MLRPARIFAAWMLIHMLVACATFTEQPLAPPRPDLVLILVGGNSERSNHNGLYHLYGGKDKKKADMPIVAELAGRLGTHADSVSVHYFSWTGDPEDDQSFLPGHWNWITGGSGVIQKQVPALAATPKTASLAVVGWSNGGATAYELACDLSRTSAERVGLLVTLDPVAWTTQPCTTDSGGPRRPAKEWISVYTHSAPSSRFEFGNIVALFGRAWNDSFPPDPPTDLAYLPNANHGDTLRMWNEKVLISEALKRWARDNAVKRP